MLKAFAFSAVAILWVGTASAQPAAPAPSRALVNQYCAYCHNDKLKSGGMSLTKLDVSHPEQNAELAERAIRKVRAGLMPPPGMPPASDAS